MAGTKIGGAKAAATNKARYGEDFYTHIGSLGGKNGHTGGFSYGDNAKKFGAKGGKLSRRSRPIYHGDNLYADELEVLYGLVDRAITQCRLDGVIEKSEVNKYQHILLNKVYDAHGWEDIFEDLGVGKGITAKIWVKILSEEHNSARDAFFNSETDENKDYYRIMRNLCTAFFVVSGIKIK